jgi:hypothetical protein
MILFSSDFFATISLLRHDVRLGLAKKKKFVFFRFLRDDFAITSWGSGFIDTSSQTKIWNTSSITSPGHTFQLSNQKVQNWSLWEWVAASNSRVKVLKLLYVTHVIKNHLLGCIRDNLKCPHHFIKSHLWQLTSSKITEEVTIGAQPIQFWFFWRRELCSFDEVRFNNMEFDLKSIRQTSV